MREVVLESKTNATASFFWGGGGRRIGKGGGGLSVCFFTF